MGPVGTGDWGLGLGLDNLPSEIIFKKAYAFIYVASLNICSNELDMNVSSLNMYRVSKFENKIGILAM